MKRGNNLGRKLAAKHERASARAALATCVLLLLLAALVSLSLDDGARAQQRQQQWQRQSRASVRESLAKPRLGILRGGRRLAFVERGRVHALDLRDKVGAARIEEAELLL